MKKLTSLMLSSALIIGCTTSLDYYKKETGYKKPHTIEEYHHFADWCKQSGRNEDRIWANKQIVKISKRNSEEELVGQIALSESYLTHLRDLRLMYTVSKYNSEKENVLKKAKDNCLEVMDLINSIPSNEIRLFGTRDEINYLCDRFSRNYSLTDFNDF